MALDEIVAKITSEGLFPIRVHGSTNSDESRGLVFIGDMDDFLKAAKALKADVIFVTNTQLEDDDFQYEANNQEENDDDVVPIYLPSVLTALSDFEKYIGHDCKYKLAVPMLDNMLEIYIQEAWWNDFETNYLEAVGKIEDEQEQVRAAQLEEQEIRERAVLTRLRNLIADNNFVRLPTQKAMVAYALEQIPELQDVTPALIQEEIQSLNAKIVAMGIKRK